MRYIMILFLNLIYIMTARAEILSIGNNASINIDYKSFLNSCFSIKDVKYNYKNGKIDVIFDYTDFDIEYERGYGDAIVTEFPCMCNLTKIRFPLTKARYIVYPHVNNNFSYYDRETKPFYGTLDNIPDLEKYNKGKLPTNGNYDTLPKHENISFPLMYIKGKLATEYHVELFCG